jgi:hypothetical protein
MDLRLGTRLDTREETGDLRLWTGLGIGDYGLKTGGVGGPL